MSFNPHINPAIITQPTPTALPSAAPSGPWPWHADLIWGSQPSQCSKPDTWKGLLKGGTVTASQHEGLLHVVRSPSLTAEPSVNQQLFIELLVNAQGSAVWLLQVGVFLNAARGFRGRWKISVNQRSWTSPEGWKGSLCLRKSKVFARQKHNDSEIGKGTMKRCWVGLEISRKIKLEQRVGFPPNSQMRNLCS